MGIDLRFLGLAGRVSVFVGLCHMVACTTDDSASTDAGVGGAAALADGSAATAGSSGSGSGNAGSPPASGSVCANPVLLDLTKPGITNFDSYDSSDITKWTFALGGDSSTGVYAGPFGYGDNVVGTKTDAVETFDMVAGFGSTYALRVADSLADKYGGGLGLWIDSCLNATAFTGISFWVRGIAPASTATLSVRMGDTVSSTPDANGKYGTCPGDSTTCVNPQFSFPVTDTWTEIRAPWSAFKAGSAAGTSVKPDGRNIVQIQWDIGLSWVADDAGVYVPVAAAYELVIDTVTFY
jgi:hypothetical protein